MKNKIILSSVLIVLLLTICIVFSCKKDKEVTTGNIEGTITDAVTSQPVNGATVTLNPSSSSAITGSDGKYNFNNIAEGDYTIQVSKTGYQSNTKDVTVLSGQTRKGDIAITPNVPILSVNVTSLDFGSNLTTLPIEIRNLGGASLDWTITENIPWLTTNPISGSTTTQVSSINITIDRTGLSQGNYAQNFSITSNGGNATISVNLNVPNPDAPTVTCANAINISQMTAEISGNISSMGSSNVIQHGHCWSTVPNPTISDNKTTLGPATATGSFTSYLSSLQANTTYYVKAYATNNNGTGYSTSQTFTTTTTPMLAQITTQMPWSISDVSANIEGMILALGNSNIIQHGFCWGFNPNPTTNDHFTQLGTRSTTGKFISVLTNLVPESSYHVRAYATNNAGTVYGEDQVFIATLNGRGQYVFFFSQPSTQTVVTIDGKNAGTITVYHPSGTTDCFNTGDVTISLLPGNYNFYASNSNYYWSDTITVVENVCKKLRLN